MNKNCDKYIRPFRFQLLQSFPYIVEDFDQYTEYQLFCKLVEKVNEVIGSENEITKEVNEIKEYLDTLDLQDEVNEKLDEMAESGELQEIVATYLNANALWCFDNVQSMKNATNLINGSYARTIGFYEKNDGGDALYKIRTITNDDVIDEKFIIEMNDTTNELIAELIYGDNINVKQIGAKGDGENDDTLIIQSALNKSKNVYIPEGVYLISATLQMNDCKTLKGASPRLSKIYSENNNIDLLKLKTGTTYNTEISNLKFDHEAIGTGNGIVFGDSGTWQMVKIDNCRFEYNNISIYIAENTGSLYSSVISNIEAYRFNSGIVLNNIGSSGNIYSNIYLHNNTQHSEFGFSLGVEDNATIENLNVEWADYNYPIRLTQVRGTITNLHLEGVTTERAIFWLYSVNLDINNLDIITSTGYNLFDLNHNDNYIDIDIIRLVNTGESNISVNNFRYTTNIGNNDTVKLHEIINASNVAFNRTPVRFGCHLIPEIFAGNFSEKIANNWKLYASSDSAIKDANYKDKIEYLIPITRDGNLKTSAICMGSGVNSDILVTDSVIVTQYSGAIKYPKSAGTISANTAIKVNNVIYYTTSNSYSADTNNYAVNLNTAVGSASGTYSLYKTEAYFLYF